MGQIMLEMPKKKSKNERHRIQISNTVSSVKLIGPFSGDKDFDRKLCPLSVPQSSSDCPSPLSVPQCSFDHCDLPELISPSNVAVYGGLCALATYSRAKLKSDVIGSA